MQQVVYGICLVYTGGTPIGSLNKDFTSLASNTIVGVPVLIWIALIVAVLLLVPVQQDPSRQVHVRHRRQRGCC